MRFSPIFRATSASLLIAVLSTQPAWGWGHTGHEMVDRLAAQFLPADVPAFLHNPAALDAMEYYGPEPDRWHNRAEKELRDQESPDHFIDMEYANLVGEFPRERYDYIVAAQKVVAAHPEMKLSPARLGFQPWAAEECWEKLKVDMREYRKLLAAKGNTAPVEAAIVYDAGILGHYVGDGSQPLHTTIQYNGWTGDNPNGYSTAHTIHAQFESTYVNNNIKRDDVAKLVAASKPQVVNDEWAQYLEYLHHTNSMVEKVYQLDKAHGFDGAGTPEAKEFVQERIAAGAIELRDLIYSAWVHSGDPVEEYKGPQ
ncbi:MAG TPA: S1/P1 nuclease [Acidobacteriaceae bacterium]|jgi:hypothetical protein